MPADSSLRPTPALPDNGEILPLECAMELAAVLTPAEEGGLVALNPENRHHLARGNDRGALAVPSSPRLSFRRMPKPPRVSGTHAARALDRLGFVKARKCALRRAGLGIHDAAFH